MDGMAAPRMNICLLTSTFAPLIGGAETYALTFALGMTSRGHAVTVVTDGGNRVPFSTEEIKALDAQFPFPVARLSGYRDLFETDGVIPWEVLAFGLTNELEVVLADTALDIVVSNSLDAAWTAKLLALGSDVPWAATFHEQKPEAEPFGESRLKLVYQVLRPDLILAGSRFYAERARLQGRSDAVAHIVHGIDTEQFRPDPGRAAARRARGLPEQAQVLVCAARLTPRKGIPDLLSAVAALCAAWPGLHLVVAGTVNSSDRSYADFLHGEAARLGIGDRVTFDETARAADMPGLFAAADLVAQPSYEEGLGLSVLEAMSCGRAVVTTDIPATTEITSGRDVLVTCQPGDVAGLASAIGGLLADRRRRAQLEAAGRQHVVRLFSRDVMMSQTERALRDAVLTTRRLPGG
jgi:glycosyltransferase involved in cell wall biosynthesis